MTLENMTWEELTKSWNIGYQYWLIFGTPEAKANIDAILAEQVRRIDTAKTLEPLM